MKKLLAYLLVLSMVIFACQKEVSFESGSNPSAGVLQSDVTGDCLPKNVIGTYEQSTTLNGNNNYIEVTVDVTTTGSFTVYSDTVNGVFFRASGTFTALGPTVVKVRGSGTPATSGVFNFLIQYEGQSCAVAVTFLPSGAGGPATFTLNCTPPPVVEGAYATGVALNSTHKVTLNVNVTVIGTYSISTTATNGMTFSANSAFTSTGPTTVTLTGSGTPTAATTSNITVTVGTSSCSFPVTVTGPAVYTIDCSSANILGDYIEGQALTTSNTVTLNVNVTTAGPYSITTTAVNGMTFTGSSTLAVGPQTITLTGSGTPAADGSFNINLNAGTTPCNFPIVVDPGTGASGTWKFTEGAVTYQGNITDAEFDNTSLPGALFFFCYGTSATGEEFEIDLLDMSASINAGEFYDMSTFTTNNTGGFYFIGTPPKTYDADPSYPTNTMKVNITSHNTTTKFISGTFSGKAEDNNGVLKDITNGTFSVTYQ